jgi:hypothetical protein
MRYYKAKRVIRDFARYVNPNIKIKFNHKGENAGDIKRKVVYLDLQEIVKNPDHKVGMTYHFKNEVGLVAHTLLHELGHIQSAHKVKDIDSALDTYSFYVEKLTNSDMVYKSIARSYARLTLEKLANEWAFNFAKEEFDKVLKLKYDLLELGLH